MSVEEPAPEEESSTLTRPEKQFVDTNILVYAYDRSAGERHNQSRKLVRSLLETGNGALSIQVLQEFHVTVTRKVARPLSNSESVRILRGLSGWHLHVPQAGDVLAAIQLQERFQISFWDAMIIRSATQLNCPLVWSEDLNHGQSFSSEGGSTEVRNPFVDLLPPAES